MVEICMVRSLEDGRDASAFPEGYSLRWYRDGDEEIWQRIQEHMDIYDPVAADLFEREFGELSELLPERQCFVEHLTGAVVGTATAWVASPERPAGDGRVHWVSVCPMHRHRGLGRRLTETACSRLRELGARRAYLTTGARNVAAVQLYLGLGFEPDIRSQEELVAWRSLMGELEPRFRERLTMLVDPGARPDGES